MSDNKDTPLRPAKINLKNIHKFIQGWIRFILYKLSNAKYLKRISETSLALLDNHKKEQFEWRLMTMDKECLSKGHCKICGCQTPQLQMADEACDGNCYPAMMDKDTWNEYKTKNQIII